MTEHRILNAQGLFCSVAWTPVLTQHTAERVRLLADDTTSSKLENTQDVRRALALIARLPIQNLPIRSYYPTPFTLYDANAPLAQGLGHSAEYTLLHALVPMHVVPIFGAGSNHSADHAPVSFPLARHLDDFGQLAAVLDELKPLIPALTDALRALDLPGRWNIDPLNKTRQSLARMKQGAYTVRAVDPVRELAEAHSAVIYQPFIGNGRDGGAFVAADGLGPLVRARHFESTQAAHRTAKAKGLTWYAVCTTDVQLTGLDPHNSSATTEALRTAIAHAERAQMEERLAALDIAALRARLAQPAGGKNQTATASPNGHEASDPTDALISCSSAVLYASPDNNDAHVTVLGGFLDKNGRLGPLASAQHFAHPSIAATMGRRRSLSTLAACTTTVRLTGIDPASPGTSPELSAAVARVERARMNAMLEAMDEATLRTRVAALEGGAANPAGGLVAADAAKRTPQRRM